MRGPSSSFNLAGATRPWASQTLGAAPSWETCVCLFRKQSHRAPSQTVVDGTNAMYRAPFALRMCVVVTGRCTLHVFSPTASRIRRSGQRRFSRSTSRARVQISEERPPASIHLGEIVVVSGPRTVSQRPRVWRAPHPDVSPRHPHGLPIEALARFEEKCRPARTPSLGPNRANMATATGGDVGLTDSGRPRQTLRSETSEATPSRTQGMTSSAQAIVLKDELMLSQADMGVLTSCQFAFFALVSGVFLGPLTRCLGGRAQPVVMKCLPVIAVGYFFQASVCDGFIKRSSGGAAESATKYVSKACASQTA